MAELNVYYVGFQDIVLDCYSAIYFFWLPWLKFKVISVPSELNKCLFWHQLFCFQLIWLCSWS